MQVWARDPNRVRKGLLTPLAGQCVLRESGVGTWSITVDESSQWSPVVAEGWGVVVTDGDATVFSGPVTEIQVEQNGNERDVTLTGVTDMHVLADRLIHPNPAQEADAQTAAYWTRIGSGYYVNDLLAAMTNRNVGAEALAHGGGGPEAHGEREAMIDAAMAASICRGIPRG